MKLRPLQKGDLEQVIKIQERITRTTVSPRWREMLARHVDNPRLPGFIAEDDDRVVGYVFGEVKVGGFGEEVSGWIDMVGISPERMGAGVGRALARRLFDHFKALGVTRVNTSVRWDSGDMLAFFKSLGFDRSPMINLYARLEDGS